MSQRQEGWRVVYGLRSQGMAAELAHRAMPEPVAHVAAFWIAASELERKLGWLKLARRSEQRAITYFHKARG